MPPLNVENDETEEDELEYLRAEVKRLRELLKEATPPLEELLLRRGFKVHRKNPVDDLLIPAPDRLDEYYEFMKRYSFRLFLRDVIKQQSHFTLKSVARYATADVTEDYINYLLALGLISPYKEAFRLNRDKPIKSFGETLEWFLAETLKREFSSEALWGVRFKGRKTGGDYDVLAKVDGTRLLYLEVKSSPPKQIYQSEIREFMERVEDLSPDLSIFFMDTELRMKDKIVPMFEGELSQKKANKLPMPERLYKELFNIGERIFIINAKGSAAANIERVLAFYLRRKA
jgi:hypothetical protein